MFNARLEPSRSPFGFLLGPFGFLLGPFGSFWVPFGFFWVLLGESTRPFICAAVICLYAYCDLYVACCFS